MQNWFIKFRSMSLAIGVAVLAFAGYSAESSATACSSSGTVADLQALGSAGCEIGDKTFYNFDFISGDITAGQVNFSLVNDGANWGFKFQFSLTVANSNSKDFAIDYDVKCTDGSACLTSIHSAITGGGQNGGFVNLAETYTPAGSPGTTFFLKAPGGQTTYDATFAPVSSMHISKDINADCSNSTTPETCAASISLVINSVDSSRVPEPGTLALLSAGLLGLGWVGRRRGKRA